MRRRKAQAGNGRADIELVDISGTLAAHDLISIEQLAVLRTVATWLHQVRAARGLPNASPQGLWGAITSGQAGTRKWTAAGVVGGHSAGDEAWRRLVAMRNAFFTRRQLDQLDLVMAVAAGEKVPAEAELPELRAGLAIAADAIRNGHKKRRKKLRPEALSRGFSFENLLREIAR